MYSVSVHWTVTLTTQYCNNALDCTVATLTPEILSPEVRPRTRLEVRHPNLHDPETICFFGFQTVAKVRDQPCLLAWVGY